MKLHIEQTFPLGRFHATPWKVFPYDDPHGEWPPSPWRLLRAILARSFQLERETGTPNDEKRAQIVRAFATSSISWALPDFTWRGPGLRQYQPAELGFTNPPPAKLNLIPIDESLQSQFAADYIALIPNPKGTKRDYTEIECFDKNCDPLRVVKITDKNLLKEIRERAKKDAVQKRTLKRYPPDFRTYNPTKVQDNFWLTPADTKPLLWIIEGEGWTSELSSFLSDCLDRLTYFGRAESITQARLLSANSEGTHPNCELLDRRTATAIPVLSWKPDVELAQVLLTTNEEPVAKSTTPPGAVWRFAERPKRPAAQSKPAPYHAVHFPVQLIQFAIGSRVEPRYSEVVRLTERFRSRVLGRFAEHVSGFRLKRGWAEASDEVKQKAAPLSGKGVAGEALKGHRHAYFFLHGEPNKPTRLCLWRKEPFTDDEQHAILSAASHPLPLSYNDDPWTITLVPLDRMVPAPAGFSAQAALHWKTLTPWVPPRHALDRKGRTKPGHGLEQQIREELAMWNMPAIQDINIYKTGWVKSHLPSRSKDGRSNTNKLGYEVHLTFESSFVGPLLIGHSAHFGLGLFVPVD